MLCSVKMQLDLNILFELDCFIFRIIINYDFVKMFKLFVNKINSTLLTLLSFLFEIRSNITL